MTDYRTDDPIGRSDDDQFDAGDGDKLDSDRPGGWAGVPAALGEDGDDPAESGSGPISREDEIPGTQGEIEAGSEGDFGKPRS